MSNLSKPKPLIIDVGAYDGAYTWHYAQQHPNVEVIAFEPNVAVASRRWGKLPNYHMICAAVSDYDGLGVLNITACDLSSSLSPINEEGKRAWINGEGLEVVNTVLVPVMRLDTFLYRFLYEETRGRSGTSDDPVIEFLKVDAQGLDLLVVDSLGDYWRRRVKRVMLEVAVTPIQPYLMAYDKEVVLNRMEDWGFELAYIETQSHGQEENLTFINEELTDSARMP